MKISKNLISYIQYPIMIFVCLMAFIFLIIFSVPEHASRFALIPEKIISGEFWRILTFQFTHLNSAHLIENIIGILLVGAIATELKTRFDDFSVVYILAGIAAIIPLFYIINFTALGASAAIYGAFGLVAMQVEKFKVRKEYAFLFLGAAIFSQAIFAFFSGNADQISFSSKQAVLHFSGMVTGVSIFLLLNHLRPSFEKKKRHILRSA